MTNLLFDKVKELFVELENTNPKTKEDIESFKEIFVGDFNKIKPLFGNITQVEDSRKKEYNELVNLLKTQAEDKFKLFQKEYNISLVLTEIQERFKDQLEGKFEDIEKHLVINQNLYTKEQFLVISDCLQTLGSVKEKLLLELNLYKVPVFEVVRERYWK